jgi:ubiquinone/menaquinone biosynthesis C-methylase UbiE
VKVTLDSWAISVLADPITKEPRAIENFESRDGIIDARIFLPNTSGYAEWSEGQEAFEGLEETTYYSRKPLSNFENEIKNDLPVYEFFKLEEPILDVGGSIGLLREFLPVGAKYLVVDPFITVQDRISQMRRKAYNCLNTPLNFIAGLAEFLPVQSNTIQTVHMRSMLDHVQVVDLCLLEAKRVLQPGGQLIVGITIEGRPYGKSGVDLRPYVLVKNLTKKFLAGIGFSRYKDEHVWHPTFSNLQKVISDAGFEIEKIFWQPVWDGKVVYIGARSKLG